ncbi:hypothetical protein [Streptomyces sp. NPDC054837]
MSEASENTDGLKKPEVGRDEFRNSHKSFFEEVQRTSGILHITYRGNRTNAVISADDAELLAVLKGPAPMPQPGDVKTAALLLTGALEDNESVVAGIDWMKPDGNNLAGGIATLLGVLYFPIEAQNLGGRFMIVENTRERVNRTLKRKNTTRTPSQATIADLVLSRLMSESGQIHALPFIAGGMWALQAGGEEYEPAHWRNSLGVPLLPGELKLWFQTLYYVAILVRDGVAAKLGPDYVLNVISDAGEKYGNMPPE